MSNDPDSKAISTIDKPPDAPGDLRAIREAKGISLRDIFEQTRISTVNLVAIESGDFSKLPAPVSARTFIKTYARLVGVDSAPILNRYAKYLEVRNAPKAVVGAGEPDGEREKKMEEEEKPEPSPPAEPAKKRWPLVLGLLVIAAAIAAALIFMSGEAPKPAPETAAPSPPPRMEQPEIPAPSPPAVQEKTVPAPPVIDAPSPAKPKEPQMKKEAAQAVPPAEGGEKKPARILPKPLEAPSAESSGKRRLVIEATELTWLRIQEDQNPSHQVLLYPGEKIERFAQERFQLDVGNAAGVDVSFEGKSLGRLGGPAEVVHLTLP